MANRYVPARARQLELRRRFLAVLRSGGSVAQAARAVGIERTCLYLCRRQEPAFADAWLTAMRAGASARAQAERGRAPTCRPEVQQRFLEVLRRGGSVFEAADAAGVSLRNFHRRRAKDRAFAAAWRAADRAGARVLLAAKREPGAAPPRRRAVKSPAAQRRFLDVLRTGGSDVQAAAAIGIDLRTITRWRSADARFAGRWRGARAEGVQVLLTAARAVPSQAKHRCDRHRRRLDSPEARARCLATLREGGAIWYAAHTIGAGGKTPLRWRRKDPEFAVAWEIAYRAGSLALLDAAGRRPLPVRRRYKRALFDKRTRWWKNRMAEGEARAALGRAPGSAPRRRRPLPRAPLSKPIFSNAYSAIA
jgi:transposase